VSIPSRPLADLQCFDLRTAKPPFTNALNGHRHGITVVAGAVERYLCEELLRTGVGQHHFLTLPTMAQQAHGPRLEQAALAHEYLETRRGAGRVVLST
jgi:hypothetical protein